MAIPALKQKIIEKLASNNWSEPNVLYILVEIGKYIERSREDKDHLRDVDDVVLDIDDYPTTIFFRNWVAHTEKDRGMIPAGILSSLIKVLNGAQQREVEKELFTPLFSELGKLSKALNKEEIQIDRDPFIDNLKCILAEQPVRLRSEKRSVGYDELLNLIEIK